MKMTKGSIGTMNQTAKRKSFRFGIILPLGLTQLLTMYLLLIVVPRPERSLFSSVSTNIGQQDQYMGSFSTNSMENDIEMDHQYLRRRIEQEPQKSQVRNQSRRQKLFTVSPNYRHDHDHHRPRNQFHHQPWLDSRRLQEVDGVGTDNDNVNDNSNPTETDQPVQTPSSNDATSTTTINSSETIPAVMVGVATSVILCALFLYVADLRDRCKHERMLEQHRRQRRENGSLKHMETIASSGAGGGPGGGGGAGAGGSGGYGWETMTHPYPMLTHHGANDEHHHPHPNVPHRDQPEFVEDISISPVSTMTASIALESYGMRRTDSGDGLEESVDITELSDSHRVSHDTDLSSLVDLSQIKTMPHFDEGGGDDDDDDGGEGQRCNVRKTSITTFETEENPDHRSVMEDVDYMQEEEDESGWTSSPGKSDSSSEVSIGTYLKSIHSSKSHGSGSGSSSRGRSSSSSNPKFPVTVKMDDDVEVSETPKIEVDDVASSPSLSPGPILNGKDQSTKMKDPMINQESTTDIEKASTVSTSASTSAPVDEHDDDEDDDDDGNNNNDNIHHQNNTNDNDTVEVQVPPDSPELLGEKCLVDVTPQKNNNKNTNNGKNKNNSAGIDDDIDNDVDDDVDDGASLERSPDTPCGFHYSEVLRNDLAQLEQIYEKAEKQQIPCQEYNHTTSTNKMINHDDNTEVDGSIRTTLSTTDNENSNCQSLIKYYNDEDHNNDDDDDDDINNNDNDIDIDDVDNNDDDDDDIDDGSASAREYIRNVYFVPVAPTCNGLGIVLDDAESPTSFPTVSNVKRDSPLVDRIFIGDVILALNNDELIGCGATDIEERMSVASIGVDSSGSNITTTTDDSNGININHHHHSMLQRPMTRGILKLTIMSTQADGSDTESIAICGDSIDMGRLETATEV